MAKIVVISDFSFQGSGYLNIVTPLCQEIVKGGHEVKAVGLGYRGEPHSFPFSIIPCANYSDAHAMANNLKIQWGADLMIVALDIPAQFRFLDLSEKISLPIISITPLENPPLTMSWALQLQRSNKVFFISQLGTDEAQKAGVETAEHLVVGMDTVSWRQRTNEEYENGRKTLNISPDTLVVLTVADNQERKNLSKAMEIVSKVKRDGGIKVKYILVTREFSDVGWQLRDLALTYGISSDVMIFERGLSFGELYSLYSIADAFLLTSKAEGLCCLPTQKIWTTNGIEEMRDVRNGTLLPTHTGNISVVTDVFERDVSEQVVTVQMGFGLSPIQVTKNHPILSMKSKYRKQLGDIIWNSADELKRGDFVYYPKIENVDVSTICPADYLSGKCDFQISGNEIVPVGRNQFGAQFPHPKAKTLPLGIDITDDFMKSLGWYIAEGCDTGDGLSFSLNTKEVEYQREISGLMERLYGIPVKEYFKDRNRYDGRYYHTLLGRFYSSMCGDDAHTKQMPSWSLLLPPNKLWPMIEAMFNGDGTFSSRWRSLRYSTVSRALAEQLQYALLHLGVVSSLRSAGARTEYTVTIYGDELRKVPFISEVEYSRKVQRQFIELETGYLFPIREVALSDYSGKVYNLEVSDDHSYLTGGGIVHNCMPVMEAMSVGVPVVATACGAIPELLGDGRGFLMETEYSMIDPWGNSRRDFPLADSGVSHLLEIQKQKTTSPLVAPTLAHIYMESRTWDVPGQQINDAIVEVLDEKE